MKFFILSLVIVFALGSVIGRKMQFESIAINESIDINEFSDTKAFQPKASESRFQHRHTRSNKPRSRQDETPAKMSGIIKRAGFFGFSRADRQALCKELAAWYMESPEKALAWVKGASSDQEHVNELLGDLVANVAKIDFHKGFELAKAEAGAIKLSPGNALKALYNASLTHGTKSTLEVAQFGVLSQRDITKSSGFSYPPGVQVHTAKEQGYAILEYPKEFDFLATMNGLAGMHAALKELEYHRVLPGNLLSEWVKRDHIAAWKWLEQGRKLPGNDSHTTYFKAYGSLVDDYTLGETIADYMGHEQDGSSGFLSILSRKKSPTKFVQGYLSKLDPTERETVVTDLIGQSKRYAGSWGMEISANLLSNLEPDARLRVSEIVLTTTRRYQRARMRPYLEKLGHSNAELDQLYESINSKR